MSQQTLLKLPARRVARVDTPETKHRYQVFKRQDDGSWIAESKEYDHSTSAFAALGKLFQKDVLAIIPDDEEVK